MDPLEGAPAGFNGCWLVKKILDQDQGVTDATWDGTHIAVVTFNGDSADYKVFSTVQMSIDTSTGNVGLLTIAGACSHNSEKLAEKMPAEGAARDMFHIKMIGTLLEENEKELRVEFDNVYVNKQREITNSCRYLDKDFQQEEQKLRFKEEMEAVQAEMARKNALKN